MNILSIIRCAYHQPTSYRPRLLLTGVRGSGQSSHLAPALLHDMEKYAVHTLDLAVLYGVSTTSPEETCAMVRLCVVFMLWKYILMETLGVQIKHFSLGSFNEVIIHNSFKGACKFNYLGIAYKSHSCSYSTCTFVFFVH